MSKSVSSPLGTIGILDDPAEIEKKVKKAVTDTDGEVRYDPDTKPGLANLLDLLAAATEGSPVEVATKYERYGDLKKDTAAALIALLAPLRRRYLDLDADRGEVLRLLREGAESARTVADATYARAAHAMGLLEP